MTMEKTSTLIATSERSSEMLAAIDIYSGLTTPAGMPRIDCLTEDEATHILECMGQSLPVAADETMMVTPTRRTDLIEKAMQLRYQVFIHEVGRDRTVESDEHDFNDAIHIVAVMNRDDVVGTLRCYYRGSEPGGKTNCIGRVAVRRDLRGKRIGTEIMTAAHRHLAALGIEAVFLHAEQTAVVFYDKLGYIRTGDWFPEAGKPHIRMDFDLTGMGRRP
jgi:predicted GNAT family N-acyltransferase